MASCEEAEQATAAAGQQLARLRVANEQVRAMGESSRVFLRYQQLDKLMPNALAHVTSVVGGSGGFVLVHNRNSVQDDEKGAVGDMPRGFVSRLKELGVVDLAREGAQVLDTANDTRSARLLKAIEQTDFHSLLIAPLAAQDEHLGMVGVFYRRDDPPAGAKVQVLVSLCGQLALVIKNMQYSEELRRMNEELTHLDELKSDFVATMSHELRTPLTSIIGYSDMLMSGMTGELNDKQTAFVDSIVQSGETLLNLINDILDLFKIESGRLELVREPVDLVPRCSPCWPIVAAGGREGISRRSWRPTSSSVPTRAAEPDPAEPAVQRGQVHPRRRRDWRGACGERQDRDPCRGRRHRHRQEDLARSFSPSADRRVGRARGHRARPATVALVELHGGAIRVQSKMGKGSSFIFTVPQSEERVDPMSPGKMS